MQRAEAGWYPDPERPGQVRYFDGDDWTTHVRDVAPSESPDGSLPAGDAPIAGGASAAGGGPSAGGASAGRAPTSRGALLLVGGALMVLVLAGSLFLGRLGTGGDEPEGDTATSASGAGTGTDDADGADDEGAVDDLGSDIEGDPDGEADADGQDGGAHDATDTEDEDDAEGPDDDADDAAAPASPPDGSYDAPFPMTIDPDTPYLATLVTTEGDIVLELDPVGAPIATNNLVNLARDGYYDGVVFHRVIEGFVIQGGDPTATGTGGPGYRFEDELDTAEELVDDRGGYPRGTLAMANAGPNTNGSQFFIVHGELIDLPPRYTVFGRVSAGTEVVDAIAGTPTAGPDRPTTDITITSVTITEG